MSAEQRLNLECLATADALRSVAQQIDRLDRAGHAAVANHTEAAVLHCNAPAIVEALEARAGRLTDANSVA